MTGVLDLPHRELCRRLAPDGMWLPNGRSEPADALTWLRLLTHLDVGGWSVRWDGAPRPTSAAALAQEDVGTGLVMLAPDVDLRLYPSWGTEAVWFDLDVRAMTEMATERLGAFMRLLGCCTGMPVLLSREGEDDDPVVGWFPAEAAFRWLLGHRRRARPRRRL